MDERNKKYLDDAVKALAEIERSTWTEVSCLAKINLPLLESCLADLKKASK